MGKMPIHPIYCRIKMPIRPIYWSLSQLEIGRGISDTSAQARPGVNSYESRYSDILI